ncbi:MAG: radical SAM protein [Bacteroides sp.]|nr:radical SAM protein [Bacteroides sp.]
MEKQKSDSGIKLYTYMNDGVRNIMTQAFRNFLGNPKEAIFLTRMSKVFEKAEQKRKEMSERYRVNIPPFLICSIANTCNLACAGCYARKNGIAGDDDNKKTTLTPGEWKKIFDEAAEIGITFALLAGGEPLTRKDLLDEIAKVKDIIFPVFTNGTLIGPIYLSFFNKNRNMIPVISIEGFQYGTDKRRGQGVYKKTVESMQLLSEKKLFFGVSITVTTENMNFVTSDEFLSQLRDWGCKLLFYVEYVPIEEGSEHLALNDEATERMKQLVDKVRDRYKEIIFLSFPGDEKELGGCLASGRGFFHIAPDGNAEPCPFSPHSDCNVKEVGIKETLKSPLFKALRDAETLKWEHSGGCTLYEHREEIEEMINNLKS